MAKIFISYARADEERASVLARQLEARGINVWLDRYTLTPGQDFVHSISTAMAESQAVLVLLSNAYMKASFLRSEWLSLSRLSTPIIPIRVDSCVVEERIGPTMYVDLVNRPVDDWGGIVYNALNPRGKIRTSGRVNFPGRSRSSSFTGLDSPEGMPGPEITNLVDYFHADLIARQEVLRSLHERLRKTSETVPGSVLLTGAGDAGKSTVAAEYARRYRADYDVVWWVRGESNALLNSDLSRLAVALGVTSQSQASRLVVDKLRNWAESTPKRWLLIIDNADDLSPLLSLLPRQGRGHVLLTVRSDAAVPASLSQFNVDVLDMDAAVELLAHRTGSDDRSGAAALARCLRGHAYSLELAAAYVKVTGISFGSYVELLEPICDVPHDLVGPEFIAAPAIELSVRYAVQESSDAAALLRALALVDAKNMPLSAIQDVLYDRNLTEGVVLLARLGLVDISDDMSLEVSPAVIRQVRKEADVAETRTLLTRLLEWFSDLASESRLRPALRWQDLDRLVSPCLHVVRASIEFELDNDRRLMSTCHSWGRYAENRGHRKQAAAFFERALSLVNRNRQLQGDSACVLNDAAVTFAHESYTREISTELVSEVLRTCFEAEGPDVRSPLALVAMSNLAANLADAGRLEESRVLYELAIERERNSPGFDPKLLLSLVHNYGTVTADLGRSEYAYTILRETYSRRLNLLGPGHSDTIESLVALGCLTAYSGDPREANGILENSVLLSSSVLGDLHPCSISALGALGLVKARLNDLPLAFQLTRRALERRLDILGELHPETLRSMYVLVLISRRLNHLDETRELLQRWLISAVPALGDQHAMVVHAKSELALLLADMDHGRRIEHIESLLRDVDRVRGDD